MSFNANGGEYAPDPIIQKVNKVFKIPGQVPTRKGYEFIGWAESKTAKAAEYHPDDDFTAEKEKTVLYAVWCEKKYTLTYDLNYEGSESIVNGPQKSNTFIITNDPVREGYDFLGWAENPYAEEGTYHQRDRYRAKEKESFLYAIWKEKTYILSFDANGGEKAPDPISLNGKVFTIPAKTPVRNHYVFQGWASSAAASDPEIKPGGKFTVSKEETVLYAVWKGETLSVTYKLNGGRYPEGSDDVVKTYEYEEGLKFRVLVAPARDGYKFLYWEGDGMIFYPGKKYELDHDIVLYAKWEKIEKKTDGGSSIAKKVVNWLVPKTGVEVETVQEKKENVPSVKFLEVKFPALLWSMLSGASITSILQKFDNHDK